MKLALRSITARLVVTSVLIMAGFLGLTGFALDAAFERSAVEAVNQRLQSYFYAFLQGTDLNRAGELILPDVLPDSRFDRPGSGLYAAVHGPDGFRWYSASSLGREKLFRGEMQPGEFTSSATPEATEFGGVYVYRRGFSFEAKPDRYYTFFVAEHQSALLRQKSAFRTSLMLWLGGLGAALLLLQGVVLRLALRPLRGVSHDLQAVERGAVQQLSGPYPVELRSLAASINRFISAERETLKRYRNTLGDLAHSLKTPLAIMRSRLEGQTPDAQALGEALEQVDRMDQIVAYQLARARASGHETYAAPVPIEPHVEGIVQSLEKLHAVAGKLCEFEIDPKARFHGEVGDLMELLGNLLENGFKWAKSRVLFTVRPLGSIRARRPGIEFMVEDDGPGVPPDKLPELLKRGVRGDERTPGHGIGLSIVHDIVASYQGELRVDQSSELGGARFRVVLPPLED